VPTPGLYAIAVAGVVLVLTGPLLRRVSTLIAFTLLVPHVLVLPGTTRWLPVDRVVLLAFIAGLLKMAWDGHIPTSAFRPTRVQAAFGIFLMVAFISGVTLNEAGVKVSASLFSLAGLVEQFLVLGGVLVAARVVGPRRVAWSLAGIVTALAVIALTERLFHYSYSRLWFEHLSQVTAIQARELEVRGTAVRVRGAAQFALEFGWVCAMVLPLVTVWAVRARRWLWALIAPAAIGFAAILSVSRSPMLGIALGIVAILVGTRFDRRLTVLLIAGALAGGLFFLNSPQLRNSLASAQKTDSVASRDRRRIALAEDVSHHPYTGLGLAATSSAGLESTDNGYLLVYASLGVPGLLTLSVALATALAVTLSPVFRRRAEDPALPVALAAGILAGILAGGAYDLFTTPLSSNLLWILAALGTAVAELGRLPSRSRVRPERLVIFPLVGAGVGLLVWALAPTHTADRFRFDAIPTPQLINTQGSEQLVGRILINTDCGVIKRRIASVADTTVKCQDLKSGPGSGEVRIEGRTKAEVSRAVSAVARIGAQHSIGGSVTGKPTFARTAPVWGAAAGLEAALLFPPLGVLDPRRRRRGLRAGPAVAETDDLTWLHDDIAAPV
jgi:hypothetical protein